jgi:hypothetical protein
MSRIEERAFYKTKWTIRKYANDEAFAKGESYEESVIDRNLLLNEGINEFLLLLAGTGGTAFSNANAYIGVGDSNTAEAATQTGLQAATNKTYKAMQASYPQVVNQTITFQSVFASADANYAWNEFTVVNASTDSGKNLNRKVSAQGTKASGQTWTVSVAITFS